MKAKALFAVGSLAFCTALWAYSTYPPMGLTGSPDDGATCLQCHDTYALNEAGTIAITIPASVAPNDSVGVRVNVALSDAAIDKWGFECRTEMLGSGASVGRFFGDGGTTSDTDNQGGVQYIFQADNFQPQADSGWWDFGWRAPNTAMTIGVYCVGVPSNSGNGAANDYVVTTAETLTVTAVDERDAVGGFRLDVQRELTVSFAIPERGLVTLSLYDAKGGLVESVAGQYEAGVHEVRLGDGSLAAGVYIIRMTSAGMVLTRKAVHTR